MNRLRKFFELSHHQRSLLLIALGGLPLVAAGVHLFGYRRMLNRREIAAEIRFGVRPGNPGMEAHAWVERDGHSLDDGFEARAFADLEPARPQGPAAS